MTVKSRLSPGTIMFFAKQGFSRFNKNRYQNAVFSFEKALGHDPYLNCAEILKLERVFSCLGRSYFELGKNEEAVDILGKSYDLFKEKKQNFEDQSEKEMYQKTLWAYSKALAKAGQTDKAKDIAHEAEEI